jgi:DNA-binding GntR family transcriptional regulator
VASRKPRTVEPARHLGESGRPHTPRAAHATTLEVMNKQERTYTILRDRIHSGGFAPLARLNIDALARELGVSQIPVREALRRLEAEGWVRFTPNVGAIVSPVDTTFWEQGMIALAILEGAASAEAQQHLHKSDMTRMRKLSAEMEEAAASADPLRFSRLNRALHATMVARCPNSYLLELLEQTNLRLDRVRSTMFVYLPHRSEEALREHVHLIELLANGSKDEVEKYARWHKLQTVEAYREIHQANDRVLAARHRGPGTARRAASAAPTSPDHPLRAGLVPQGTLR